MPYHNRRLRRPPLSAVTFLAALLAPRAALAEAAEPPSGPPFSELWAYLMSGEERFFDPSWPISDLAYFAASIGSTGSLAGVPDLDRLPAFPGRIHLVVAEVGNYALSHFCLDPAYPLRDQLLVDIAMAARPFDGVQIDFEAVGKADREHFVEFLRLLKAVLGDKLLSVALPARYKEEQDLFGYERIGRIVDRVIVMAYDEHWSGGEPGPVSSLDWARKVAEYAATKLPPEKLVMGSPFYGRAWADKSLSRAYKHSALSAIIEEKGLPALRRSGEIPFFEYDETVTVRLYFDDAASTLSRLSLYRAASVRNVAFWRLGQEDPAIWAALAGAPEGEAAAEGAEVPEAETEPAAGAGNAD